MQHKHLRRFLGGFYLSPEKKAFDGQNDFPHNLASALAKCQPQTKSSSPIHSKRKLKINQKLLDEVREVVHNLASVLNEVGATQ